MSERVSQTILLCEDELHERFTKAYLKRCGLPYQSPQIKALVASREQQGGNDSWVLNEFPRQLHACRQRQKRAKTLLIALIDADNHSVDDRRRQLLQRVESAGFEAFGADEPAAVLIPKRHIETWIRALLSESVSEEQDCKTWQKPTKDELHRAAETLFAWSRPNATPGPTCVQSLKTALPEWKKIG
ncbi:MAG: hypothetical protein HY000_29170 [Planctomycetes bacterium]|nr:hypothetical protein [Planctomycetota bacterium]